MKTIGISPKVLYPAIVGVVVGVIFLLTGDTETGRDILLSVAGAAGIGAVSGPGNVKKA